MKKSLVISEQDSIAAILENDRVVEFFVNRGELLLGDIYSATVENILPGIDAAFVNLGKDKMGFLHANDVPGQGPLKERLVPKQKLLVQITKEPTGHKGPRVSTAISLPGRFLVLVPEERGVSISRRISEARERARLKSVVNLMKPPGVGLIIRTEAKGQGENELFEDFEQLWDRWQTVVSEGEGSIGPTLIYRDQDLLYRVIRDAYSTDVTEIICDTADGQRRAQEYLQGWAGRQTRVMHHSGDDNVLVNKGVDREIEAALSDRVEMPSGGHLNIQPTEALTVIDVNSGRFTSSRTQAETVRRTNLEAAQEIARQLRLRNIGGMVIVDFIDMDSRKDQQQVLEVFQRVLEEDRAKPQCGQLSDLGLVELTRRRQGQSLRELFTTHCSSCSGLGVVPVLEIGSRVLTFKAKEDEMNKRGMARRPMRQQPGVLRAATAHNGRIVPTVEEEAPEDFGDVPEEILEQMPDDLMNDPAARQLKGGGRGFNNEAGEGDDEDTEELSFEVQPAKPRFPAKSNVFEESFADDEDESRLSADLSENISAVSEVFSDMGTRTRSEVPAREPSRPAAVERESRHVSEQDHSHKHEHGHEHGHDHAEKSEHEHGHEHDHKHENGHDHESGDQHGNDHEHGHEHGHEDGHELGNAHGEDEQPTQIPAETPAAEAVEEEVVSFASTSPYETEYDPITGVYRLKARNLDSETSDANASHAQNLEIASDVNDAVVKGEQLSLFGENNAEALHEQHQHAENHNHEDHNHEQQHHQSEETHHHEHHQAADTAHGEHGDGQPQESDSQTKNNETENSEQETYSGYREQ